MMGDEHLCEVGVFCTRQKMRNKFDKMDEFYFFNFCPIYFLPNSFNFTYSFTIISICLPSQFISFAPNINQFRPRLRRILSICFRPGLNPPRQQQPMPISFPLPNQTVPYRFLLFLFPLSIFHLPSQGNGNGQQANQSHFHPPFPNDGQR